MLVRFFRRTDEPDKPRGEILTPVRDLGELYPDEWRALLAEAGRPRSRDAKPRSRDGKPKHKRRGRRRRRR